MKDQDILPVKMIAFGGVVQLRNANNEILFSVGSSQDGHFPTDFTRRICNFILDAGLKASKNEQNDSSNVTE